HYDAAIADEDARFQREITRFRYGKTVDVVNPCKLTHGYDLVIAVAREAAEFLHNAGEAPEYRPVALKQLGGAPDGTGHVQRPLHALSRDLATQIDLPGDLRLMRPS